MFGPAGSFIALCLWLDVWLSPLKRESFLSYTFTRLQPRLRRGDVFFFEKNGDYGNTPNMGFQLMASQPTPP